MKLADIAVGNVYRLRNGRTAKVVGFVDTLRTSGDERYLMCKPGKVRIQTDDRKLRVVGPQAIQEHVYVTKTGRVLTDSDIEKLEAERGYEVD